MAKEEQNLKQSVLLMELQVDQRREKLEDGRLARKLPDVPRR